MEFGIKGYLVVLTLCALIPLMLAGCATKGCCTGKDNQCITKGERLNRSNKTSCFCDETCIVLGDCCVDYHEACIGRNYGYGSEDCVLAPWGDWEDCSETCGWGHKTRRRQVIQNQRFAGKECEDTTQKAYCYGQKCKGRRQNDGTLEIAETGSLIPAEYGSWRQDKLYNPYNDIRKNLFNHHSKNQRNKNPSYCATFEVTETRKACENPLAQSWVSSFEVGQQVCVECQPSAMKRRLGMRCKGHGSLDIETKWNAVTVPGCHGEWKMVTQHKECQCDARNDHSFIFI